jgi:dipeptidyl aminopeptidase/acylaminoacyl peptidase
MIHNMKKRNLFFLLAGTFIMIHAPALTQSTLSIETIMQGERFTGFPPEDIQWSPDSKKMVFSWNPDMEPMRSLYAISIDQRQPYKVSLDEKKNMPSFYGTYNKDRTLMVYSKDGDIWLLNLKTGIQTRITHTAIYEGNPVFNRTEDAILYTGNRDLYSLSMKTGILKQLTSFGPSREKEDIKPYTNEQEKWLYEDQLRLFKVLAEKKMKRELSEKEEKALEAKPPKSIDTGKMQAGSVQLSQDGKYITYRTYQFTNDKGTIVPNYVTESGYTEDIQARSKVGSSFYASSQLNIYDLSRDTIYLVRTDDIPGLTDVPAYMNDYPVKKAEEAKKRSVILGNPIWSEDGKNAVLDIYSNDSKDRWIMLLDIQTGVLRLLDRQRDEAWISGPGIGFGSSIGWLPDNHRIYYQSEASGYSHLYTCDIVTGIKTAITSGNYEIYDLKLSNDKKSWYFTSNEGSAGERNLYRMSVADGKKIRLTSMKGGIEYYLSPDEKYIALRHSLSNKPWELYLMANKENAIPQQVTWSTTQAFDGYRWRVPAFVHFTASDGAQVPARRYDPEPDRKNGAAVIFVHGAGYLQNAHTWWSDYFREYMFNNFLADQGYTVLDIDYRGSAGYGRDWRTSIYRHMGGKDLDDQVDGARYLVENYGVDPARIGIYGGSYGGFITLMAMFTKPGVFKAGVALRAVTDWAHYNHGYTSDILNTPVSDSLSYVRSSPIYYAEGLKGALLMCHGMIDDNVHFQDVVRLSQRLIELGKENWELAVYPLEQHSFTEPSSWIDEYKRIFKLFENNLK